MKQPAARVEAARETVFGVELVDPYRWMEQDGPEFREWIAGQAAYTDRYLAGLPGRAELLARITELTASGVTAAGFAVAGAQVFCLRQDRGAAVPVLAVREAGDERVLLDPAGMTGNEHSHLDWYVPSPDGRHVACGISQGGSENSTLRIIDVAAGGLLAETIPRTPHGAVSWLPDGSGFVYHRFRDPAPDTPPPQRRYDSGTFLHRLGTPVEDDVLVLARGRNPLVLMSPRDRPFVLLPGGSDWMIAVIAHGLFDLPLDRELNDCTLYAAPRTGLDDPASCPWREVAGAADGVTAFTVDGNTMYVVSHRDTPQSAVMAVSLPDPALSKAAVVVPGGERAICDVRGAGGHLLVLDVDGGVSRLRQVPLASGRPREVPLPVNGTIREWSGYTDGVSALFVLQSWTSPPRLYRYDWSSGTIEDTGWIPPSPVDLSDVEVTDLRVPARDGTLIPLCVLHHKGLMLDGSSPVVLTGYGSHGWVQPREFSPQWLAWYERGGVYAVAGLRGGGDYGRPWHEAGRGPNKELTITDFIDCAEHLIAAGYTRPGRLAGMGGSAGGIPAGGALVRRPDLWAAMVLQVPVTNLTRQEFSQNANTAEHGTVRTESGLRARLIIDSYLRIEDGTQYPAMLLTTGLNDPRVAPWQPAKMAARLQAATTSGRPVLLRVDTHAGHGLGSTREQRNQLTADILAFLLDQLLA